MRGVRARQDEHEMSGLHTTGQRITGQHIVGQELADASASGDRIPAAQADPAGNRGVGRRLEGLDAAGIPLKTDAPQADPAAARGLGQRQIETMGGADAARVPATQAPSLASGFAAGPSA
jgi:hypothetical protein